MSSFFIYIDRTFVVYESSVGFLHRMVKEIVKTLIEVFVTSAGLPSEGSGEI